MKKIKIANQYQMILNILDNFSKFKMAKQG